MQEIFYLFDVIHRKYALLIVYLSPLYKKLQRFVYISYFGFDGVDFWVAADEKHFIVSLITPIDSNLRLFLLVTAIHHALPGYRYN